MKIHYINILLFPLSLNIWLLSSQEYNQRNHNLTLHKSTTTSRLLYECELYSPSNYDNDPEMKKLMQDFDRQVSERYKEYEERMIKNKQKCKEQCEKDTQKIILNDKIEKELTEKLAILETNITTEDLPTCECEKSVAHKMEKTCLGCGGVLSGGIAPTFALIGSVAINMWKTTEIAAAMKYATAKGLAAGIKVGEAAGKAVVIESLKYFGIDDLCPDIFKSFLTTRHYAEVTNIANDIIGKYRANCMVLDNSISIPSVCETINTNFGIFRIDGSPGPPVTEAVPKALEKLLVKATYTANTKAADVTPIETLAIKAAEKRAIDAASYNLYTTIGYSVLAILIIVLIMIIIYLILRYRRKKKMKKKLQYIKLLQE